jgi:hypothetical protein
MLAPLTDLVGECKGTKTTRMNKTKKRPWRWDPIHQQAFDNVKAAIAKETVLAYPDFLKPFEIYTDASSTQLGAVITQDDRPIAFFSRKLSKTQQKYMKYALERIGVGIQTKSEIQVYLKENKDLNVMLRFCILSGRCSIIGGIFCQLSLSAFLRRKIRQAQGNNRKPKLI